MTTTFIAMGLRCGKCAANVTSVLSRRAGVQDVTVDIPTRRVTVQFDDGAVSVEQLASVLTAAGYAPEATTPALA